MASYDRSAASDIVENHFSDSKSLSFFQAVQLFLARLEPQSYPGEKGPFEGEAILFRGHPSLGFSARDIEKIEVTAADSLLAPVVMDVNFLGLYGPSSPLPAYFTEDIIYADPEDSEVRHFLDIFNHRFISFFYRSWVKYRYPLQYAPDASDHYSEKVYALCGLKDKQSRDTSQIDWERLFPFIGLMSANLQSPEVLRKVLCFYIDYDDIEILPNIERILEIDPSQRIRLGEANSVLGADTSLGNTIRDCTSKFKIKLNKLSLRKYLSLLPGTKSNTDLHELVKFCLKDPIDFDLEMNVDAEKIPESILSNKNQLQLGRTSWLGEADLAQASISFSA